MVKIRLSRKGRKKNPFYKIIVVDERKRREADPIEFLGYYDPQNKSQFKLDQDRVNYWMGKGAQATETVARLIKIAGKGASQVSDNKKETSKKATDKSAEAAKKEAPAA